MLELPVIVVGTFQEEFRHWPIQPLEIFIGPPRWFVRKNCDKARQD